jgi:hypothetical protein
VVTAAEALTERLGRTTPENVAALAALVDERKWAIDNLTGSQIAYIAHQLDLLEVVGPVAVEPVEPVEEVEPVEAVEVVRPLPTAIPEGGSVPVVQLQHGSRSKPPDCPTVPVTPSPPTTEAPGPVTAPTAPTASLVPLQAPTRYVPVTPRSGRRARVVGVDADGCVVASATGTEQLGAVHSLPEVVELTARVGAESAWLTEAGTVAIGLPMQLPERPFGCGIEHPQVNALVAAGWKWVVPSDPAGLDVQMVLRQGGLTVAVRPASWVGATGKVPWPRFAKLGTAAELAHQVCALQLALAKGDRGWTLGYGHPATWKSATSAHAGVDFERLAEVPEGLFTPDTPNWWAPKDVPEAGYIVLADRNRDFLGPLGIVEVPLGQLGPVAREDALFVRARVVGGRVPLVQPDVALLLPATLTALADEDPESFGHLEDITEYLGPSTGKPVRYFRYFCDAVHAGLPAMPPGSASYLELKNIISKGVSMLSSLEYTTGDNANWWRPDWQALHGGLHVANIWRSINKARAAGAVLVGVGGRDGAAFWVPERDAKVPGLKVGTGTGDWKITASGRAGMVKRMIEGGAGIDQLKAELR